MILNTAINKSEATKKTGVKSKGCTRIDSSEDKRAQSANIIGFKSQTSPGSWLLGGSPVPPPDPRVSHDPQELAGAHGACGVAARSRHGAAPSSPRTPTFTRGFRGALMKGRCRGRFAGMFILRCLPSWVPTEERQPEDELLRRGVPPGLRPAAGAVSPLLGHPEKEILQTLPSSLHNIWDWPHLATAHIGLATWFHLSQAELLFWGWAASFRAPHLIFRAGGETL